MANSCNAELTTSVAGGCGNSGWLLSLLTYKDMESCSGAPPIGDSN
jgi:hypothetical protein